jgi:rod shape determining protein RodA
VIQDTESYASMVLMSGTKLIIAFVIAFFGILSTTVLASVASHEFVGQAIFVVVGVVIYALMQYPIPRFFWRLTPFLSVATWIGLIVTLFVGRLSHGAMRWLPVGPIHLQLSELAKPLLALVLSSYVTTYPLNTQRRVGVFALLSLLFFLPVFLQPDLGSSLVLAVTAIIIVYLSIPNLKMLVPWVGMGVMSMVLVWNFVLYPYQRDRILSFGSTTDVGASYNARQALITVGSGKVFGRGLGHGVQSALKFLPEFHTDFFFASFAEELGYFWVVLILVLYLTMFYLLIRMNRNSSRRARLFSFACSGALFFQMAVHMGMNMRLFPITGIPLPLLTSGGSSFLSICFALGLCVRLADEGE